MSVILQQKFIGDAFPKKLGLDTTNTAVRVKNMMGGIFFTEYGSFWEIDSTFVRTDKARDEKQHKANSSM